jgi:hypothetical protein
VFPDIFKTLSIAFGILTIFSFNLISDVVFAVTSFVKVPSPKTCNIGFDDRPSFQITGYTTEKTHQVMSEASIDKVVKI